MESEQVASLSRWLFGVALGAYAMATALYGVHLRTRREAIGRWASGVAWAGLAVHAGSVVARGVAAGRGPWGNMFEYSSLLSLLVVAGYLLFVEIRAKIRTTGAFVLGFAALTMAVASMALYTYPAPLVPALNSYWREIHVITVITGSSLLTLGGIFSILYLVKDRREQREAAELVPIAGGSGGPGGVARPEARPGPLPTAGEPPAAGDLDETAPPDYAPGADEPAAAGGKRRRGLLPSAATLDRLAYRTIAVAFPIWTFAIIAGAIWAERAWGRYWGWDPKETWAFITWVVFAGYLHARATAGWRGRKAAWVAVGGFAALLVTYYAVNLFIVSLHSYAGV